MTKGTIVNSIDSKAKRCIVNRVIAVDALLRVLYDLAPKHAPMTAATISHPRGTATIRKTRLRKVDNMNNTVSLVA